jgi:PHD/YefM family antitoxin component YafN of YafNO toxin-antitoxin module
VTVHGRPSAVLIAVEDLEAAVEDLEALEETLPVLSGLHAARHSYRSASAG